MIGILAAPFVSYVVVFVGIGVVILIGVTAAAIESRHVWLNDPERNLAG